MRILIAEDEKITRMTLARQLQNWGHEVVATENGQQAWEAFGAGKFDMVITDWEMPRMSGVVLVAKIREISAAAYTYVIMLTSRSDKSDVVEGIEAGADDFVTKPFDRDELRVRLLAGERIIKLEQALSRQNEVLRDANERIRSGLNAAARIQQSMLPRENVVTPRVCTAWKYVPTDELAGDSIGLHLIDDRFLVAYVLDVSGHGVPAALLSVTATHALAPIPAEVSLLRDLSARDGALGTVQRPARVAAELNRRFRAGEQDGRYLTMILCVLDTAQGKLFVARAGHPSPLILRGGQELELPDVGGFPIAMFDEAEYEDCSVQLQPADRVCLFSDGIIEQTNALEAEQFGSGGLRKSLAARCDRTPEQIASDVVKDLSDWAGGTRFSDDVSLVVFEWRGA